MFRQYHYLTGSLPLTARCYEAIYNDKPIAFIGVVHTKMKTNYFRVSRLVVLPDYQGLGIGKRLLNFISELYTSQLNLPFFLITSNPQLIRGNLTNWKIKRIGHATCGGKEDNRINMGLTKSNSRKRLTVSLQYIPQKRCYSAHQVADENEAKSG